MAMRLQALFTVAGLAAVLGACTPAAEVDNAMWPKAGQSADFSFLPEVRTAAAACIVSELNGPQNLASLQEKGYAPFKDVGRTGLMKSVPLGGKGFFDDVEVVRVSDKARFDCSIEVPRNKGYTALAEIGAELIRQGYALQRIGGQERYIGNGKRFRLSGKTSLYTPWATIDLGLVDGKVDRTCRDTSLPANLREGC